MTDFHVLTSISAHRQRRRTAAEVIPAEIQITNIITTALKPINLFTADPAILIFDIRALWRSGLSARALECYKLKM